MLKDNIALFLGLAAFMVIASLMLLLAPSPVDTYKANEYIKTNCERVEASTYACNQ